MKTANREFEKIQVTNFGIGNINHLINELRIKDINATFKFADKLEANQEINNKKDDLKKKQCKTDRCRDWVYFHARS